MKTCYFIDIIVPDLCGKNDDEGYIFSTEENAYNCLISLMMNDELLDIDKIYEDSIKLFGKKKKKCDHNKIITQIVKYIGNDKDNLKKFCEEYSEGNYSESSGWYFILVEKMIDPE
jgi:hypothetical protein